MSRLHAIQNLTSIPNIGERLATRLYEELGIRSAKDLVDAAVKHRLQGLQGIGPRREAQLLESALASVPDDVARTFEAMLRCPTCGGEKVVLGSASARCESCRRQYAVEHGVVDLMPLGRNEVKTVTQRLMESRFYARVYQDVMRPRLQQVITEGVVEDDRALVVDYLELSDSRAVLDVACGTGRFIRQFAREVRDLDDPAMLVGIDMSWPLLESARVSLRKAEVHQLVTLVRGPVTRVPLQASSFDRLHCSGALHIMEHVDEALAEFARLLEPGGICVVGTLATGDGILRRAVRRLAEVPSGFHIFGPGELHRRMARVGLNVVAETVDGDRLTVKAIRS